MAINPVDARDTIAAIATPAGRGGVGIVRVSGPRARQIYHQITSSDQIKPRQAELRQWLDRDGEIIDEGIVLYFSAPNSYTGEDVIEFQGHGSPVLLQTLLARLYELGCRPAVAGEFTRRAVEHGRMNLAQAEAVAACIDAATQRAGKQAIRQLQGAFGDHIQVLMQRLTGIVAHLEATLDFPEDEIPNLFFSSLQADVEQSLIEPIASLLKTAEFGVRLFDGAIVAITGAPNVGKSSLLNRLAGYERAIVSDIPGTTRDILEVDFEVHGIPVRLADTAGIRHSDDTIESEGVRRAVQAAEQADATIFVADATRPESWAPASPATIYLMNKIDLSDADWPDHFIPISVAKGLGIELLMQQLAEQLGDIHLGEDGLLVTRDRHKALLEQVLKNIYAGLEFIGHEDQIELVALHWRRAWSQLAELLGIGETEDILDHVFAGFCIGK